MSKFAKIFERDGKQVLVLKDENDDGKALLQFRFLSDVSDNFMCVGYAFSDLSQRDEAFDRVTDDNAFGVRDMTPGVEL